MSSLDLDPHTFTDLMKASSEAMGHLATEPQKQSGNYRKGRTRIHGLDVVIEQPRYTYRTGTDKNTGVRWSCVLEADYGYFAGTSGADDEAIDCFVGVFPESNAVYVINQQNESGGFDEHKVMLGFLDYQDAKNAYQDSYTQGWGGFADMIPCTMAQFKWWLKFGDHKKPITRDSLPFDTESEEINMEDLNFNWAEGEKPTAARVLYKLGEIDTGEELLEPVTMSAIMDDILGEEGGEEVEENEGNSEDSAVMDALVIKNAQLERKANIIGMALNRASNNIKVAENGVQISKPYMLQGVTQRVMIFEMTDGQTISAFLHNPDVKPKQISADDNLIAWKWLLNRKDITIVVAKESGKDLRIPVVAARVMALVNKNSSRFLAANEKKVERTANIANLEKTLEEKRNTLQEIVNKIDAVKNGKDTPPSDPVVNLEAPENSDTPPDNQIPPNEESVTELPSPSTPVENEGTQEGNPDTNPEGENTNSTPNPEGGENGVGLESKENLEDKSGLDPEGKTPDLEVDPEGKNTEEQSNSEPINAEQNDITPPPQEPTELQKRIQEGRDYIESKGYTDKEGTGLDFSKQGKGWVTFIVQSPKISNPQAGWSAVKFNAQTNERIYLVNSTPDSPDYSSDTDKPYDFSESITEFLDKNIFSVIEADPDFLVENSPSPVNENLDSQSDSESGAEKNTANFLQAIIDNGDITSFGFDVSGLDDEKLLDVLGDMDSEIPIADSEERDLLEKASQVVIDQTLNTANAVAQ